MMPLLPRLFLGTVMHRRLRPACNAFVYPVFYVGLPLRRLAQARCGLFSINRRNVLSFYEKDHGPRDGSALIPWVEAQLRARGLPDDGEIWLQSFPRVFGWVFNPVSFWYCHDRAGALIAVLAEVNNTFGGHHHYWLHNPDASPLHTGQRLTAEKVFHVSPFNQIEGAYAFTFQLNAKRSFARIDYDDGKGALLLTTLSGQARPWGSASLLKAVLRMPWLTVGIVIRIHWQALKLWLKGVPFHGAHVSQPIQDSSK